MLSSRHPRLQVNFGGPGGVGRRHAAAAALLRDVPGATYLGLVEHPARVSISTCVGCGSMREFATCEGVCRERKLELISGGDYDELVAAARACRIRIERFLPVVEELAATELWPASWRGRYESVRERASVALQETESGTREAVEGAASQAEAAVVWCCPDCGGLEAPQPCIGVCIWRPMDWVEAAAFETVRAKALRDMELEESLIRLLARFAHVIPREGQWERNWLAFGAEARRVLGSRGSGCVGDVTGCEGELRGLNSPPGPPPINP